MRAAAVKSLKPQRTLMLVNNATNGLHTLLLWHWDNPGSTSLLHIGVHVNNRMIAALHCQSVFNKWKHRPLKMYVVYWRPKFPYRRYRYTSCMFLNKECTQMRAAVKYSRDRVSMVSHLIFNSVTVYLKFVEDAHEEPRRFLAKQEVNWYICKLTCSKSPLSMSRWHLVMSFLLSFRFMHPSRNQQGTVTNHTTKT